MAANALILVNADPANTGEVIQMLGAIAGAGIHAVWDPRCRGGPGSRHPGEYHRHAAAYDTPDQRHHKHGDVYLVLAFSGLFRCQ